MRGNPVPLCEDEILKFLWTCQNMFQSWVVHLLQRDRLSLVYLRCSATTMLHRQWTGLQITSTKIKKQWVILVCSERKLLVQQAKLVNDVQLQSALGKNNNRVTWHKPHVVYAIFMKSEAVDTIRPINQQLYVFTHTVGKTQSHAFQCQC